jgi:hypothetical protein
MTDDIHRRPSPQTIFCKENSNKYLLTFYDADCSPLATLSFPLSWGNNDWRPSEEIRSTACL